MMNVWIANKKRNGKNEMQQCSDCLKVYDETKYTHCPYCEKDDEGYDEGDCPECNGSRKEECYICEGDGINLENADEVCPECNGESEIDCGKCLA